MTRVCPIRSLVRSIFCLREIRCDEGHAVVEFLLCEFIREKDLIFLYEKKISEEEQVYNIPYEVGTKLLFLDPKFHKVLCHTTPRPSISFSIF